MSTNIATIINFILEHIQPDLQISDVRELDANQTFRQLQKQIIQEYQSTFLYRYGVALGKANIEKLNQATIPSPYKKFKNVFELIKEQHITADKTNLLGYYTVNILDMQDVNYYSNNAGQYYSGGYSTGFFGDGFYNTPNQQPNNKETLSVCDCYIDENYVYTNSDEVWFYSISCSESASSLAIDKMQAHEWKALAEMVLERKKMLIQSAQAMLSNMCNQKLVERNVESLLSFKLKIINFR